jgi:DNA-binding NarL/FixJ family response regulator
MNGDAMSLGNPTIRVLVCNKYNLFREGIKAIFREIPAIEIVGMASTAEQALLLLMSLRPDVILLDATTSDLGGSEITRRIKAIDPNVGILILSLYDDEVLVSSCLDAGAAGYIGKDDEPLQLSEAITTAYARFHHAA